MILRRVLLILLGLVVLLACLAVTAPARLVALALPPGQVAVQGFSGRLWEGRASRVVLATDAGLFHLGELRWTLHPLSLLTLTPRVEISSDWGNQHLQAELLVQGDNNMTLRNVTLNVDAALARYLAPVMLRGQMSLQAEYLQLRNGLPVATRARVLWQQAAWESPRGILPLGTYALDVQQAPNGPLLGEIVTLAGPVRAEGELQLQLPNGRYSIATLISHETGWEEVLEEGLSLLAKPVAGGYQLRLEGQLDLAGSGLQ
ncbi:hypothetical protein CWI75_12615 [Kineobactrum sediminis]|uniref:Type II secretion system protein N n=1 Tax=Kineobactrum sediminis TaxID=1905677 RepID=A0A2N5Y0M4_9GAMM|nr:type II secretion system protein N [Kineobactrum sediminis]PLW81936.1 hypothetical protein CWI75_12615 [Kineobactrum sediminis]